MITAPYNTCEESATDSSHRPDSHRHVKDAAGIGQESLKILEHGLGQKCTHHGTDVNPEAKTEHLFHWDAMAMGAAQDHSSAHHDSSRGQNSERMDLERAHGKHGLRVVRKHAITDS